VRPEIRQAAVMLTSHREGDGKAFERGDGPIDGACQKAESHQSHRRSRRLWPASPLFARQTGEKGVGLILVLKKDPDVGQQVLLVGLHDIHVMTSIDLAISLCLGELECCDVSKANEEINPFQDLKRPGSYTKQLLDVLEDRLRSVKRASHRTVAWDFVNHLR
jgi:hypothetical protein